MIFANQGVDESFGGDGNDQLWALARSDVTASGDPVGDTLHGENGNDTIHVRDGEVDNVDCGDGNDHVIADQFDIVANNCEHVDRKDVTAESLAAANSDKTENSTQDPKADSTTTE